MTKIPSGYTGASVPLELSVSSSTEAQVALVELWKVASNGLPTTGSRITGFVILGALMLLGGALLIARRRKDQAVLTE